MKKLKLMTIVGTRPEIIKMSAIIKKADKYLDHVLVHTGQNYDYNLNEVFFKDFGLREPDYYLGVVGKNIGETMGNVISKAYDLMVEIKPDAVIVLGDTNSCLSIIAAKRLKIPIFHMEAGNRCKDENLPEEVIRRIVDVTSDVKGRVSLTDFSPVGTHRICLLISQNRILRRLLREMSLHFTTDTIRAFVEYRISKKSKNHWISHVKATVSVTSISTGSISGAAHLLIAMRG